MPHHWTVPEKPREVEPAVAQQLAVRIQKIKNRPPPFGTYVTFLFSVGSRPTIVVAKNGNRTAGAGAFSFGAIDANTGLSDKAVQELNNFLRPLGLPQA